MKIFLMFAILLVSIIALGQDTSGYVADWVPVDPVFVPPSWLESVLLMLKSMPVLGPILVPTLQWLGVLAVTTTSLAVTVITSVNAASRVLRSNGKEDQAKALESKAAKVIYVLKRVSLLNAQIPPTKVEKK